MSIEQSDSIDLIATSADSTEVVMTISDHLFWHQKDKFSLLDAKISNYLAFVKSGQLGEQNPKYLDKKVVIQIVSQYFMNKSGEKYFADTKNAVARDGIELRWKRVSGKGESKFSIWINSWLEPWLQR